MRKVREMMRERDDDESPKCVLCERRGVKLTAHHLVPRLHSRRRGEEVGSTISICPACHAQLHLLFSHRTLAEELDSVEKIREHPDFERFLRWVKKQDPQKRVKMSRKR